MTWCKGTLKYLGESVTVCSWSHHFSLWNEGQLECLLQHSAQSDYLCSGWPGACADFPTKSRYDIFRASSGDVPMMWGFWMMTFILPQLCQDWGYKRMNTRWGRGSQFWDCRCRAYRAKLIPSRVFWCSPTLGQPGILYLLSYKVFSLLNTLDQHLPAMQPLFLLSSVVWVTIKPAGQA